MFTVAILAVARPAPAAPPRSASLQSETVRTGHDQLVRLDLTQLADWDK
jgi:hypothetical protein